MRYSAASSFILNLYDSCLENMTISSSRSVYMGALGKGVSIICTEATTLNVSRHPKDGWVGDFTV